MAIEKGDVLFDQVESELADLINPGDGEGGTTDIHSQVMEGLATEAENESDDKGDTGDIETTDAKSDGDEEESEDTENDDTSGDAEESDDVDKKDAESDETKTDKKPPDQDDPEYKEALKVKEQLNKVLEEYGLNDIQDLVEALNEGADINEILGDLDIKEVLKSHKTLEYYNEEWAKREAAKAEEDEEPEDTIERLKREKQELIDKDNQRAQSKKQQEQQKKLVEEFDATVDNVLETTQNIDDDTKSIVRQLMGIDNPSLDIPISDKRATVKSAREIIKTIRARDAKLAQKAIDDNASGKSKITITKKEKTPGGTQSMKSYHVAKDATPDQAVADANAFLTEILEQAVANTP